MPRIRPRTNAVGVLLAAAAVALAGAAAPAPATAAAPARASAKAAYAPVSEHFLNITRGTDTLRIPYCGTGELDRPAAAVTRIVVVVHGDERNACGAARHIAKAAAAAGRGDATLVVAPLFATPGDGVAGAVAASTPRWDASGWKEGADSRPLGRAAGIGSFEVLDRVLDAAASRATWPGVGRIVLAGHSAGGQFVNRYTALRPARPGLDGRLSAIVANPSSYLYLDARRLDGDTWRVPTAACRGYDRYKYGLTGRTGDAAVLDDAAVRARAAAVPTTYLAGERDTARDADLDTGCSATAQGPDRLERARRYVAHLATLGLTRTLAVVPGVGHSAEEMYASAQARDALFG